MIRLRPSLFPILMLLIVGLSTAGAEIPQVISYQGKVTDTSGNAVADASYTMRFRIYDAVTVGTLKWDSGAQTVSVAGGVFTVLLGESPQPVIALDFSQDYWLLVTFSGVDQTPRQRLASVGYAYMASGLVPGTVVTGSVTTGSSAAIAGVNTAATGSTYGTYGQVSSTAGTGLYGWATATIGYARGVVGVSSSPTGIGVVGYTNATSGANYGVYGYSPSSDGRGVYGYALHPSGSTYGGYFESESTDGIGVYGYASAASGSTIGVHGWSGSNSGRGVYGYASATTGTTYGVWGRSASASGRGVYGHAFHPTGAAYGGYFESESTTGRGVYGNASATTGSTYGGRFESQSPDGAGVSGYAYGASGFTCGVWGRSASTSGRGVYGSASAGTGTTYGGRFESESTDGSGVQGTATAASGTTYGVYGQTFSTSGRGVFGDATASTGTTYGVLGQASSTHGRGVTGLAVATSGDGDGVYGWTDPNSSGYGVYYVNGLGGIGKMTSIVRTSMGPTGLGIHTTAGDWVEDFGEGRLIEGQAHVELDPLFLETVTIDAANPMKVFVQLHDETCKGVAVKKGSTTFDVTELWSGASTSTFDYRVVAKRKGFEAKRLDYCPGAEGDPALYPELLEGFLQKRGEERARLEEAHAQWEKERRVEQAEHDRIRNEPPEADLPARRVISE